MRPYIRMIRHQIAGKYKLAVKDIMKAITMQLQQETVVGQTLWILLNNQKEKTKIGVMYLSGKCVTPKKYLNKLFTSITEEIIEAKEEDQQ